MTRTRISIFALGFGLNFLAACNGGEECADCSGSTGNDLDGGGDCTADCPEPDDTGDTGDPDATATFVGPAVSFTGPDDVVSEESCTTNLARTMGGTLVYQVVTAEQKKVEPDSYVATFGDPALASSATANLPVHTLAGGWEAIAPATEVPVADGETVAPAAPALALLVRGTWTCEDDIGFSDNGEVAYEQVDDEIWLTIPTIGDAVVSGMNLDYVYGDCELHGAFIDNAWLYVEANAECGGRAFTADCWTGTDPR